MTSWRTWTVVVSAALLLDGCVIAVAPHGVPRNGEVARVPGNEEWRNREVPIGAVERLVMKSRHHLHIVQGDRERLTISGPASAVDAVEVGQRDGVLTIDDPVDFEIDLRPFVTVSYPPGVRIELTVQNISEVDLEGHGAVEVDQVALHRLHVRNDGHGEFTAMSIQAGELYLTVAGHGEMRLGEVITGRTEVELEDHGEMEAGHVTTRELGVTVKDHGRATLSGVADRQRVAVDGQADYYGRHLNSREARVRARDHGHVHLWVDEQLSTDVDRSATLRYEGSPRLVNPEAGTPMRRGNLG